MVSANKLSAHPPLAYLIVSSFKCNIMRPSGIGWLGDVPAHWKTKRLSNLFTESNKRATTIRYVKGRSCSMKHGDPTSIKRMGAVAANHPSVGTRADALHSATSRVWGRSLPLGKRPSHSRHPEELQQGFLEPELDFSRDVLDGDGVPDRRGVP